jgi:hypothetical protein
MAEFPNPEWDPEVPKGFEDDALLVTLSLNLAMNLVNIAIARLSVAAKRRWKSPTHGYTLDGSCAYGKLSKDRSWIWSHSVDRRMSTLEVLDATRAFSAHSTDSVLS